jgi:flagellar basal body rod protein FlgG
MKKILVVVFIFLCSYFVISQETERAKLQEEFAGILRDLSNIDTIGYKCHLFDTNNLTIDFSQASLQQTNRMFDFAILGNGFFKIKLFDGRIGYTRAGEFTIDAETNELITIDGYYLFDSIRIEPGFSSIVIDNNSLIAIYPNGETVDCGLLKTYEINTEELYEDSITPRSAEQSIPYFIGRVGGMVVGVRNNGKNDGAIYFYKGSVEKISESFVVNNYLEIGNVEFINSIFRLLEISRLLDE